VIETKRAIHPHPRFNIGVGGARTDRTAPTILNAAFNTTQFWDGRAPTLEAQALKPILNPDEMVMTSGDEALSAIRKVRDARSQYHRYG